MMPSPNPTSAQGPYDVEKNSIFDEKVSGTRVTTELAADVVTDGVWGALEDGKTNYRSLGWISASVMEVKVQIGLGVLALPSVLATLGLVPGILVISITAAMAFWTQWQIFTIKKLHPEVFSLADVGELMFGSIGREVFGAFFWLLLTVIAGAAMLGISTGLNALSTHGACTAVFVCVAAIATCLISSVQTLEKVSWFGWVGAFGIMASIITLVIAVSVQDRPADVPKTRPWSKEVVVVGHPSFVEAMTSVSTILLSFAGGPYYFNIIAELRNPEDYPKSIALSSIVTSSTYLIIGSVVYHYCGQYVSSPALGSAGVLMKKICYGLAIPGLIVSAVLNTHISAKYVFVRLLRRSRHLTEHTWKHYIIWGSCILVNGALSFVVAESIPVFNDLVSLAGAILGTPCAFTMPLMLWFFVKRHDFQTKRTPALLSVAAMNGILLVASLLVTIGGLYANVVSINKNIKAGAVGGVFSCADNSNSV